MESEKGSRERVTDEPEKSGLFFVFAVRKSVRKFVRKFA